MISVEKLNECKEASSDLIEHIKERVNEICNDGDERNSLEGDFGFEFEGVSYDVVEVDTSNWEDEGKYQYQDSTYQLVSFDKTVASYPCEKNIINKFNLFLNMSVSRTGSYYSDYYYMYDSPSILIAEIKHIPEQVIPAHDIVEYTNI